MRRRSTVIVVCALLLTAGCLAVGPGVSEETESSVDSVDGASWRVTVTRVIDGDTVEVRYENGSLETVRLLGIDTPEVYSSNDPTEYEGVPDTEEGRAWLDRWGEEASAFVRGRLAGEQVLLQADDRADRRGDFGRLLAYVHHDGADVNELLLSEGLARVYPSTFSKRDRYETVEREAMDAGVGLWGFSDGSPTQTEGLGVESINYDADGNDNENPTGESVVFVNRGDEPLDLTGYRVHDEAGREYAFPDGLTLAPGESVTLRSGRGTDRGSTLYWGSDRPVWNNDGDTVTVVAPNGTVVIEMSY